jgi:hypothetical protein
VLSTLSSEPDLGDSRSASLLLADAHRMPVDSCMSYVRLIHIHCSSHQATDELVLPLALSEDDVDWDSDELDVPETPNPQSSVSETGSSAPTRQPYYSQLKKIAKKRVLPELNEDDLDEVFVRGWSPVVCSSHVLTPPRTRARWAVDQQDQQQRANHPSANRDSCCLSAHPLTRAQPDVCTPHPSREGPTVLCCAIEPL